MRFQLAASNKEDEDTATADERERAMAECSALAPSESAPVLDESDSTVFQPDELTALVRFTNSLLAEATPNQVVHLALETVLRQTKADLAGFLSVDAKPEERMVLPTQATVDPQLSKRLTQQVVQLGRTVWLASPQDQGVESDSLSDLHDALCIPLRANVPGSGQQLDPPLGALHVYKTDRPFNERQVRFCEVLAGSLATTLHLLRSRRALEADNSRLRVQVTAASDELVGSSAKMCMLRRQIRRLADSPCTVLIVGESGVGKELVALGLHQQSSRHRGPLVIVNSAAIAGSMAESELFGHVKGAFTGATRDHAGYFAQAEMGTLVLDEVGEMPLELQAKLLRAIENRCFRPVGARSDRWADVRVIAATNRDLEREVQEGQFRRDLLFRLTSPISVPPLREHIEDVPELVQHFLESLNKIYRRNVTLSEAAQERLMTYSWPGNVRQLRSVLERAVAMAENSVIHANELHLSDEPLVEPGECPPTVNLEALEEWAIRQALARTANNNTQAARLLGIHRDTLINKQKKYGITRGT